MTDETVCAIALTCIPKLSGRQALELYKHMGNDATPLFAEDKDTLRERLHDIPSAMFCLLMDGREGAYRRAVEEWEFIQKHNIGCLCYGGEGYPVRLTECDDAPLVLYYKGNADLNSTYILNVVGTRSCTEYGKDVCRKVIADLSRMRPDILIVSGLAYGIDIHSHRNALATGLKTVAVIAHGMDRIYPSVHRDTAKAMLQQGGMLTEYMKGTQPERGNFLSRNRIIAGLADACLVVESASKGGSLVTARIAQGYGRDVLAVPGRITDKYSEGCNGLIRHNTAALVTSAEDILHALNWPDETEEQSARQPVEQDLFGSCSEEEMAVIQLLQNDDKQINQLVVESNMPVARVSAVLFELEMRNIVRLMAGGRYHLIK